MLAPSFFKWTKKVVEEENSKEGSCGSHKIIEKVAEGTGSCKRNITITIVLDTFQTHSASIKGSSR